MGTQQSTLTDISSNETLKRFAGTQHLDRDDKFWDELITFNLSNFLLSVDKADNKELKEKLNELHNSLASNNKLSGNFTTLACISIFYAREILTNSERAADHEILHKCCNALFMVRSCCEFYVANLSEEDLIGQFNTLPSFDEQPTILEEFLLVLSELIAFLPLDPSTHHIHLEAVTIFLVLLCTRMFDMKISGENQIYLLAMNSKCSVNSTAVIRKLFHNFIKNETIPPLQQGLVGWATSGIWSMFSSGSNKKQIIKSTSDLNPLAGHSLLLLLVFSFHFTRERNPYREAVFYCKPGSKTDPTAEEKDRSFPLNFKMLHSALARDLHHDRSVLLMYLLLHKNSSFLNFVLAQDDLESIVVPVLEVLYNADEKNPHHIYMALIVVLIFTQEDKFNSRIHDMPVTNVLWYKEKSLIGITLGSLLILIVLRTIQYNMAKMRDKYLHTNCLASLANMASKFKNLHSTVTQKFISLFNQLTKRHTKLSEKLKEDPQSNEKQEQLDDLAVLEEIIHMLIEILNACLSNNIEENCNLIFSLLRSKELLQSFRTNPKFQDIIQNVDMVLTYFDKRVDDVGEAIDTAEGIINVIKESTKEWPKDQMKKFPQLKFKYMEEEAAEEFFIPYIWSIIYSSSFLYWDSEKITLFQIQPS